MSTKAQQIRQLLINVISSGGTHKDQAEKYRSILDSILTVSGNELVECLQIFIEASKYLYVIQLADIL